MESNFKQVLKGVAAGIVVFLVLSYFLSGILFFFAFVLAGATAYYIATR
jgi:hypothetical protein